MKVKIKSKVDMRKLPEKLQREISRVLMAAGYIIEFDAKQFCPVNTGRLRASIHTEQIAFNKVEVGTNVFYAPYVEYGTLPHFPPVEPLKRWAHLHGMPEEAAWAIAQKIAKYGTEPQPFMRPAFMKNKKLVKKLIKNKIKEILKG